MNTGGCCCEDRSHSGARQRAPGVMGPRLRGDDTMSGATAHSHSRTAHKRSRSRGMVCPSHAVSFRPLVTEGAGKAGCRLAPMVRCAEGLRTKAQRNPQGSRDNPAFPAQWVDGLCRGRPGETSSVATVALPIADASARLGEAHHGQDLTPASGVRTTRFCRTRVAPFVRVRMIAHEPESPPCNFRIAPTQLRPPHPGPRFVTTREPPLVSGRNAKSIRQFRIRIKRNIFAAGA